MIRATDWARRWRGQPGRLEVWYATLTDPATGTGLWVHGEQVAPTGGGDAHRLGWAAMFPPDGSPAWALTEPTPGPVPEGSTSFVATGLRIGPDGSAGTAGDLAWDLTWDASDQRPLFTFPRWAWTRELLPAAQIVPAPDLAVSGTVSGPGGTVHLDRAPGQVARIYGHGNAERWAWLHADLGDGDLVEAVTAVSTRPGLNRLPPITHLRFRLDGRDWPGFDGPSFGVSTRLGRDGWSLRGRIGRARLRLEVRQPAERCVLIPYADPDGRAATCANTERADLDIELVGGPGGGTRRWELRGTAHAELGFR